jgi:hypothetical protein
VCMYQCRQAKVRVVQRSRGAREKALGPQLSVGKLFLSTQPVFLETMSSGRELWAC